VMNFLDFRKFGVGEASRGFHNKVHLTENDGIVLNDCKMNKGIERSEKKGGGVVVDLSNG